MNESKSKSIDRVTEVTTVIAVMQLGPLAFESDKLQNTLGGSQLSMLAVGFALLISFVVYRVANAKLQFDRGKRGTGYLFFSMVLMGTGCMFTTVASYINRAYADSGIVERVVHVEKNYPRHGKRGSIHPHIADLIVELDGKENHIVVTRSFADKVAPGSLIVLEVRKGYFGYPYVANFKQVEQNP